MIRCVCGKKIGPDPRNFNQRVSLGRNDLLIRTFPNCDESIEKALSRVLVRISDPEHCDDDWLSYCGAVKTDAGKWSKSKVDNSTPIIMKDSDIEMVIITGMIM
ncbi:hypothetical protein ACLEWN_22760 [Escherichia coli]